MALSAELGYRLMESGAEIYRVEESMQLLLHAYGVTFGEVFAIPNCIIVTLTAPDGRPVTQIRRVPAHGTNLDQVERLNDLCRRLCRGTPPLDEAGRPAGGNPPPAAQLLPAGTAVRLLSGLRLLRAVFWRQLAGRPVWRGMRHDSGSVSDRDEPAAH